MDIVDREKDVSWNRANTQIQDDKFIMNAFRMVENDQDDRN